jgi:hypothetical protein
MLNIGRILNDELEKKFQKTLAYIIALAQRDSEEPSKIVVSLWMD